MASVMMPIKVGEVVRRSGFLVIGVFDDEEVTTDTKPHRAR